MFGKPPQKLDDEQKVNDSGPSGITKRVQTQSQPMKSIVVDGKPTMVPLDTEQFSTLKEKKITRENNPEEIIVAMLNPSNRTKSIINVNDGAIYKFKGPNIANRWFNIAKMKIIMEVSDMALTNGDGRSFVESVKLKYKIRSDKDEEYKELIMEPLKSTFSSRKLHKIPNKYIIKDNDLSILTIPATEFFSYCTLKPLYMKLFFMEVKFSNSSYWPINTTKNKIKIQITCPHERKPIISPNQSLNLSRYEIYDHVNNPGKISIFAQNNSEKLCGDVYVASFGENNKRTMMQKFKIKSPVTSKDKYLMFYDIPIDEEHANDENVIYANFNVIKTFPPEPDILIEPLGGYDGDIN